MLTKQKQMFKKLPNCLHVSSALRIWTFCFLLAISFAPTQSLAFSEERIVAVVNGTAVTSSDVVTIRKILRLQSGGKKVPQSRGLKEAIEINLKLQEAENRKVTPPEEDVDKRISEIATSQKKSRESYLKDLKRKGIDPLVFKKFLSAQIGWSKIIQRDYGKRVNIDKDAIQTKYEKIKNNPKPGLRLIQLRNVLLPIEKGASREIIGARLAEAKKIASRFKKCSRLKSITVDIYNVRIGKIKEIPLKALNPKARKILRKAGPGKIFINGVNPKIGGVQLTAYCGNRTLKAPVPSLKQYTNKVFYDQIQQYSNRHMKKVKDLAIIEIKGN